MHLDTERLKRRYTWTLFGVFFVTVPCLYLFLVVAGFAPALYFVLDPLIGFVRSSDYQQARGYIGYMAFTFPAAILYGALEYGAALLAARWLVKLPPKYGTAIVASIAVLCGALSMNDIYFPISHNGTGSRNLLNLYRHK
jgi:hypothetical protein